MISTMAQSEDKIRMPRPYRGDTDEDDGGQETAEPNNTLPLRPSNDGTPDIEDDTSSPNDSVADSDGSAKSATTARLPPEDVIKLVSASVSSGILETQRSMAGNEVVSDVVKPKLTINLGHKNIGRIPDAVVDIIKDEVARLSLSNNFIFHVPYRFAECSHLRYLNIRSNSFREFPRGVCNLPLLEILDLSWNKITSIPEEISKLSSLRVLSVIQNRIDELPLALSDMGNLQILKFAGNPLRYPLRRIVESSEAEISHSVMTDNEKEVAITAELKRFLKGRQPVMVPDPESGSEAGERVLDTPKPFKRGVNSRFPVVPRSPSLGRPPPIPTKSHYRLASGPYRGPQRPGPNPISERNRSNSEGIIQASVAARNKRMGVISRKNTDLGTLDETQPYRSSHFRGLSHGSILRSKPPGVTGVGSSSSPSSPRERRRLKDGFVNRMSSLPEHKGEAEVGEPIIGCAKGILFALFQVQYYVSFLINVIKREDSRRNSLEIVFYNACTHVDRLNEALENAEHAASNDPDSTKMLNETVKRECETCVMAYTHVATQLRNNAEKIVAKGDSRYVRALMLMIYGSVIELRNACTVLGVPLQGRQRSSAEVKSIPDSTKGTSESGSFPGPAVTPTRDQPPSMRRFRSDTTIQHPQTTPGGPMPSTSNYQSAVSSPGFPPSSFSYSNRSRSSSRSNFINTSIPSSLATPRSGESFPPMPSSVVPRINPLTGLDEIEEERIFERIFHQLTSAYTAALHALPLVRRQFARSLEIAEQSRESEGIQMLWNNLIRRSRMCLEASEALGLRLSNMKVKEPGGGMRNQREFWQLCKTFMQSFVDLVTDMREVRSMQLLPPDIVIILRPVQRASREAGRLVEASPWSFLADMSSANGTANIYGPPLPGQQSQHHANSSMSPQSVPIPATPLSAALGPAAQATVPSTPASAYSDKFFEGDVFQRADFLLSMPNQAPFFTRR